MGGGIQGAPVRTYLHHRPPSWCDYLGSYSGAAPAWLPMTLDLAYNGTYALVRPGLSTARARPKPQALHVDPPEVLHPPRLAGAHGAHYRNRTQRGPIQSRLPVGGPSGSGACQVDTSPVPYGLAVLLRPEVDRVGPRAQHEVPAAGMVIAMQNGAQDQTHDDVGRGV